MMPQTRAGSVVRRPFLKPLGLRGWLEAALAFGFWKTPHLRLADPQGTRRCGLSRTRASLSALRRPGLARESVHPCERANNKLEDHAGIVFGAGVGVGLPTEDLIVGGMRLVSPFVGQLHHSFSV